MQPLLNGVSLNLCSLKMILDALPLLLKVANLTSTLSYALQNEPLLVIESLYIVLGCFDFNPLGLEKIVSAGKLSLQVIPDAFERLKLVHVPLLDQERLVAMFVLNGGNLLSLLISELADGILKIHSMALLHKHLSVHVILLLAELNALMCLGLSLLLCLQGPLLLQKLLFVKLVISQIRGQTGPEVVSLTLTAPQLLGQLVVESLHAAAVSGHLYPQVLHGLLLLSNDVLLFIELHVEKTFHVSLVFQVSKHGGLIGVGRAMVRVVIIVHFAEI